MTDILDNNLFYETVLHSSGFILYTKQGISYLHQGVIGSYAMLKLWITKPETAK
jgi:hypothetical protein